MKWASQGACVGRTDVDFFMQGKRSGRQSPEFYENQRRCKAICNACPVIDECREWAIAYERHGIWGGLSEFERRGMTPDAGQKTRPGINWTDQAVLRERKQSNQRRGRTEKRVS